MVAHTFTFQLAPFASKLVNFLRHSETLNFRKYSKLTTFFSFEKSDIKSTPNNVYPQIWSILQKFVMKWWKPLGPQCGMWPTKHPSIVRDFWMVVGWTYFCSAKNASPTTTTSLGTWWAYWATWLRSKNCDLSLWPLVSSGVTTSAQLNKLERTYLKKMR